jgi:hypothetical protein
LFFYISGMTGAFYNVEKRGFIQFFIAKVKRLFLPFVVAYCLILIPRLYFAQGYQDMCQLIKYDDNGKYLGVYLEWNYWKYYKAMFVPAFGKLSWLWFLIALFINSICNYPLLGWIRRRTQKKPLDHWDAAYVLGLCIVMGCWCAMNIYLPEDKYFDCDPDVNNCILIGYGSNVGELLPMALVNLFYNLT